MAGKRTASPVDDARAAALLRMDTDSESDAGGDAVGGGRPAGPAGAGRRGGRRDCGSVGDPQGPHLGLSPVLRGPPRVRRASRKAAGAAHDDEEAGQLWVLLSGARESFAKEFPLSEALWLEWVEDCEKRGEERAIGSLLERAVGDYPTPALWKRRMEHERKQGGLRQRFAPSRRQRCGRAGADVANGAVLWEEFADSRRRRWAAGGRRGSGGSAGEGEGIYRGPWGSGGGPEMPASGLPRL